MIALRIRATLLFLILSIMCLAQQELDERALIEVKNGISIRKDSLFLMNLRFRMQNRLGYNSVSHDDVSVRSIDARIRRLRLRFDGYVLNKDLRYYIQLNFSRADLDLTDGNTTAQPIRDAMVFYHFNENFYIGFGQTKLPGNRQRVTSSGSLQFPDRSIANSLYTLDRDFGVFAYWNEQVGGQEFRLKGAYSTGDGRNALSTDDGMAYTGRLEWLPFGAFANDGDYSEGDLEFEQEPKLSFGATFSHNEGAVRTQGQLGSALFDGRDIQTFIGDMLLKYKGWALLGEYFDRMANDPITYDGEEISFVRTGIGINGQLSHVFKSRYEIAGRYTTVWPGSGIESLMPRTDEVLLGSTKYLNGHRIKLQLYTGYRWFDQQIDHQNSFWTVMFQVEFGI